MVLGIGEQDGPKPKCYFTHATLPTYIDNANPPAKKEPFKSTLSQQYNHTVRQESPLQDEATQIISILIPTTQLTLLLPTSPSQQTLHSKLSGDSSDDDDEGTLRYARVHMKPIDLISGDFFNSYIKAGNVVMLSEGRVGIDTVLSLCEGILRIEVDRSTFEKLGLEGKCEGGGEGRKHGRERFAIELNLRLPSMLPGHKAFSRLQWAFKHVLTDSLTWLFHDLRSPTSNSGALAAHAPSIKTLQPQTESLENVLCPALPRRVAEDERESAVELLEWLSLAMAGSPRVRKGDGIDPFLCRYRPAGEEEGAVERDLVLYQWRGFVPAAFAMRVLLAALKNSSAAKDEDEGEGWFALAATAFDGNAFTVLRNEGEVMTWNYAD